MNLDASVVWIHNGKTGEKKDKHAILRGEQPLMTGDKVFVDVNITEDDGSDAEDAAPADMGYELYYGGKLDAVCDGEVLADEKDTVGKHWLVGSQGVRKLRVAAGNAIIFRLKGGVPGTTGSKLVVKDTSRGLQDEIVFPYTD